MPAPGDIQIAADDIAGAHGPITTSADGILRAVPNILAAADLEGAWITGYQFRHGGEVRHHVDVARIAVTSDRDLTITNQVPAPRTEGRTLPFRNEIEAQIVNRHLVGHWRNTSDARYFGSLHLAVLPGETVMEGYYTGFGSDIEVSLGHWRWVRLDQASATDESLARVALREPAALHDLVVTHSQYDPPLSVNEIREAA